MSRTWNAAKSRRPRLHGSLDADVDVGMYL